MLRKDFVANSRSAHRCIAGLVLASFAIVANLSAASAQLANPGAQLAPRPPSIKPPKTTLAQFENRHAIAVKFRDDLPIRVINGLLTDRDVGILSPAAKAVIARFNGGRWVRAYPLDDPKLAQLRHAAQQNLRKQVADLRTQFTLILPPGTDAASAIDALNALDIVEIAQPMPTPLPAPLPPSFQSNQGYINPAPTGIDAVGMWGAPYGSNGAGIRIADVEYSWNFAHQDLPPVTLLGAAPVDPFNDLNHGTAVLGELGSLYNGSGTTGATYASTLYAVAANTAGGYNVGAAVLTALANLSPGDVILIEQQTAGPNYTGSPPGTQFGLIPVEWYQPWYNAIVTAVGNGVIVVEAAGNGSQNLDDPIYSTGHAGHYPFLLQNDSGAIIVGAGGAPSGGSGDRSRLSFSCYGATVDLQGWGERVCTTGYGSLYSFEGVNNYYTASFSGTSSASPIVASACALVQAYFKSTYSGQVLPPDQLKALLRATGSPQLNGANPASQNIGPRPNATAAAQLAFPDCNHNGIDDAIDVANHTSPDCDADGKPDECQVPPLCLTCADCQADGIPDLCQVPPICPTCDDCNVNLIPDVCDEDCNVNGSPDLCDIVYAGSQDCTQDNIPDECQVPPLCPSCLDCQADGVPDICQAPPMCSDCPDCDGDGIPDDCAPDCNANGRSDVCDVLENFSDDCAQDFIPDECQLPPFCPNCPDCNSNSIPDACELSADDCNNDGVVDRCQTDPLICIGNCLSDCDHNFKPDECQIIGTFEKQSPNLVPLVSPVVQVYTLVAPPPAAADVTLTFRAVGDIDSTSEFVAIDVNNVAFGNVFTFAGASCPAPYQDVLVIPAATWNAAVANGDANIHMTPNALVDNPCGGATYISVKIEYSAASGDCNANQIPDFCDIAAGTATDCNANAIPDDCDINAGLLHDFDQDNRPDECACNAFCPGDLDLDFMVDGRDIQPFIACIANGNLATNDCGCTDLNNDLQLTSADINLFITKLLTDPDPNCP